MMKLSTKGRYGLRAMIDLAQHHDDRVEPVMMSDIAERQALSKKYNKVVIGRVLETRSQERKGLFYVYQAMFNPVFVHPAL